MMKYPCENCIKDIPADSMAVGNPCKVIKGKLQHKDLEDWVK